MTQISLRKKLRYQAWHRGTKEADFLIGRFSDFILPQLTDDQLHLFQEFLEKDDMTLLDWYFKRKTPDARIKNNIIRQFLNFDHGPC